jgi:hypothetical protein
MPACSQCQHDIDVLINTQLAERSYEVRLHDRRDLRHQLLANHTDVREEEYPCPDCAAALTKTEWEPTGFLSATERNF